jgi:hypothetical protein
MAEKITKQEAVRRALKELGNDAKPAQMRGWIRDTLGIEMTADHISTSKGAILRKQAGKGKSSAKRAAAKKVGPKKKAAPGPEAQPRPAPANGQGKEVGIPLVDILYVKQLVGRFGPQQLHTLIDAFAR